MQRPLFLLFFAITFSSIALAQSPTSYYPPLSGDEWATTDPAELGWCTDSIPVLYHWLEASNTRGFLVLKDGRIVLERYFGTFTQDSVWYWASAGKGLTAFLVGIAQEEGALDIHDPTSLYLGSGWTNCAAAREDSITIWHQLTMTNGMNELIFNCTLPACLNCLVDPGTRWAYHNGPYRLLRNVVENATGENYNAFTLQRVLQPTGMQGFWLINAEQQLFISRARDMARFGILVAQQGNWNGTQLLQDTAYLRAMLTPSQDLNRSYGYLWWLNGQPSHRLPATFQEFPGPISPQAPADLVAALGANGQILDLVPSEGLVVVRLGAAESDDFVPSDYHDELWRQLNRVRCPETTAVAEPEPALSLRIVPNPVRGTQIRIEGAADEAIERVLLYDLNGRVLRTVENSEMVDGTGLSGGVYIAMVWLRDGTVWRNRVLLAR